MSFPSFRILSLLSMVSLALTHQAQTPSNVEAAEYEPNSDRWFVSNGNSILVTADEGESWSVFGDGGATHGMEVLGTTLFAIQSNVIRAFDVVTGEQLGSLSPGGVGFLNGMGSESGPFGDLLVVSDFAEGRLLRIDVSDPTDMVASTLVSNTGTTPNGVTILNGVATVVNWGNNADILQVDVATGEVTTLIDGTGLGFCDGVDWANGSLIVSSWNPQRISRFTPNAAAPTGWDVETMVQGAPLDNPADLSVNSSGDRYAVACSGNSTVYFGDLPTVSAVQGLKAPSIQASLTANGVLVLTDVAGHWTVRGYDVTGRLLGASDALHQSAGEQNWTFDDMGDWVSRSTFLEMHFDASGYGTDTWTTTLKRPPLR